MQGGRTRGARKHHEKGLKETESQSAIARFEQDERSSNKKSPAVAPKATVMRSPGKTLTKCT